MKTILLRLLLLTLLIATNAQADQARYESVTINATPVWNTNGYWILSATNNIQIAEGEVGELVCAEGGGAVLAIKNSVEFYARPAASYNSMTPFPPIGTTVAGPATFQLRVYTPVSQNNPPLPGLMTVKITPLTYSPQKSVTVAPGMGNVQIEMESSTNLLTWATATNGVYNDNLRFFRVKLTKLNP